MNAEQCGRCGAYVNGQTCKECDADTTVPWVNCSVCGDAIKQSDARKERYQVETRHGLKRKWNYVCPEHKKDGY